MRFGKTEGSMALIGGALLGAAAMYLMDPEVGERRRRRLAAAAEDALGDVSGRAKSVASNLGSHAAKIQHEAAEYAQHLADQAHQVATDLTARASRHVSGDPRAALEAGRHMGAKWFDRARHIFSHAHDAANDYADDAAKEAHAHASHLRDVASHLWNRARGFVSHVPSAAAEHANQLQNELAERTDPWRKVAARRVSRASHQAQAFLGHEEPHHFGAGTLLSSTIGCCAVGAGLMYFLDPKQGHARQKWAADKIMGCVKQTGQAMRGIGRDMSHWIGGGTFEAEAARRFERARIDSEQLIRRIRAEISNRSLPVTQVQFMADADGTVTVTGNIRRDEVDGLLTALHRVPGVDHVINRLNTSDASTSSPRGTSAASSNR